jgi:hypothetical protein
MALLFSRAMIPKDLLASFVEKGAVQTRFGVERPVLTPMPSPHNGGCYDGGWSFWIAQ